MNPTPGGTILEAEDVCTDPSLISSGLKGFSGKGYVGNGTSHARQYIEWNYNAPVSGEYILEFRYTLNRDDEFLSDLEINGKNCGEIRFWSTGNPGAWAWERVIVTLEKGNNTIAVSPENYVLLDHLNIIGN
jgi:hypothetical protein